MSVTFNLDGTKIIEPDTPEDYQVVLAERVLTHTQHLSSGFDELRNYRDDELSKSDWTQVPDGPLDSTTKAAWATYREKLRDLPADAKAPYWFAEASWPLAPGESAINPEALGFIINNDDPLGIATTSWVGVKTSMDDVGTIPVVDTPIGVGTDIIGVAHTEGIQVGDHLRNLNTGLGNTITGTVIGIVSGITTISVSLASTTPAIINDDLISSRVGFSSYEQDKPSLTLTVGAAATTVNSEGNIKFTINTTNQVGEQTIDWNVSGVTMPLGTNSGEVTINPNSSYVGVSTISITVPTVTEPNTNLTFGAESKYGTSVEHEVVVGVITA